MYLSVAYVCVCTQGCLTGRVGSGWTLGKRLVGDSLQDSSLGNPNCPCWVTTLPSLTLFTCPLLLKLILLSLCSRLLVISQGLGLLPSTGPGALPSGPGLLQYLSNTVWSLTPLSHSVFLCVSSPPLAKVAAYWEKQQAINSH